MSITHRPSNPKVRHALQSKSFQSDGANIDGEHLISLSLKEAKVGALLFHSSDPGSRREGFLNLDISGQPTRMSFKSVPGADGMIKIDDKFTNKALYFGKAKNLNAIEVKLTESDQDAREFFGEASELLSLAAKSPLGSYHPAIGGGLSFIASIAEVIKKSIKDTDEAIGTFFLEVGIKDSDFVIDLFTTIEGTNISILRIIAGVTDLGAPIDNVKKASIVIPNIKIDLTGASGAGDVSKDVSKQIEALKARFRIATRKVDKKRIKAQIERLESGGGSVGNWINNQMRNFHLETASNERNKGIACRLPDIDKRFVMQNYLAGEVKGKPTQVGGLNTTAIPFSLEIGRSPDEVDVEQYFSTLESGANFVSALGGPSVDKPEFIEKKVLPSALGFLSEFLNRSLTLYSFSGVIRLLDTANGISDQPGVLIFTPKSNDQGNRIDGVYTKTIQSKVKWRGDEIGIIEITIDAITS